MTRLIIIQIIKPEEQDNYLIHIYENMKKKTIVVTELLEDFNRTWWQKIFAKRKGAYSYDLVFDECNLKEGDIIDVELKPFLVDAKYFEVKN